MSRANRRRAAVQPASASAVVAADRERAPRPTPDAAGEERRIVWSACLLGWLVGEAVLLVLVLGGLALANAAFGGTNGVDGGIVGVGSFLGVMAGGWVAGRRAGSFGGYQGTVVAILFIVVYMVAQFVVEAVRVHSAFAGGTHSLVDLGSMDLGGVFSIDLIALFGGTMGGWLARR